MFCRPVVFLLHFQDILSEMGVTTKTGCCFDLVGGGGGGGGGVRGLGFYLFSQHILSDTEVPRAKHVLWQVNVVPSLLSAFCILVRMVKGILFISDHPRCCQQGQRV